MDDPSPFTPNWGDLPAEMKLIAINHMDAKTRTALKQCSKHDSILVESTMKKIDSAEITIQQGGIQCKLHDRNFGSFKSTSLADFGEKMKNIGCIERLKVMGHIPLDHKLFKHGIKVKSLSCLFACVKSSCVYHIVCSMDPDFLESVHLSQYGNGEFSTCFDLPQITQAQKLYVISSSMTDEQLLNLEATDLTIGHSDFITNHGLNAYVKKCLSKLDNSHIIFKITMRTHDTFIITEGLDIIEKRFNETGGQFIINSKSSRYQLRLEHSESLLKGFRIGKQ